MAGEFIMSYERSSLAQEREKKNVVVENFSITRTRAEQQEMHNGEDLRIRMATTERETKEWERKVGKRDQKNFPHCIEGIPWAREVFQKRE